jgi:class 3 adenylate cyclase
LVAEIKQFYDEYPLVDSLAQPKGSKDLAQQGYFRAEQTFNEQLGAQSSQFLDVMAKTIHKYGGDIVQFVGNSIVAIWPRKLFTRRVIEGVDDERVRRDRIEEDSNVIVGRKAV